LSVPTTVVLDLGNVLIDWDPRRLYRRLIPDAAEREQFLTEVAGPGWHDRQDRGRPLDVATAELAAAHPDRAELVAAYYGRWSEMFGPPLAASVDVMRDLHEAGVRLLALTNWPAEKFAEARDRFAFLADFEGVVVSGEEGVAKPDEELFRILLDRYDVDPGAAVYVDDNPRHVETAGRLGMTAYRFTSAWRLRRDLAGVGLPVDGSVEVRGAGVDDLAALTDIYNGYVVSSGATFDLEPVTVEANRAWLDAHAGTGRHRLLVAASGGEVVGYASSGTFRTRPGYDPTVEVTVYLRPGSVGRGVGSLLYQELFAALADEDVHLAVATIALPNDASVALHRRFGFVEAGTLPEAGHKLGRWWDVRWMQRPLP
jgi:2-haloacid dehalogenase